MNNVTDLKTSQQLVPYMAGVETKDVYDDEGNIYSLLNDPPLQWSEWYDNTNRKVISWDELPTILTPAYSLTDLLSVMPGTIAREWVRKDGVQCTTTYTRILTDNSIQYAYLVNTLNHIKGSLIFFDEQSKIKNATQAAAGLILWLGEQGHMTKEGE